MFFDVTSNSFVTSQVVLQELPQVLHLEQLVGGDAGGAHRARAVRPGHELLEGLVEGEKLAHGTPGHRLLRRYVPALCPLFQLKKILVVFFIVQWNKILLRIVLNMYAKVKLHKNNLCVSVNRKVKAYSKNYTI